METSCNNLENYKKLILMTEFILVGLGGLEDDYVSFLKGISDSSEWEEFKDTINSQIETFEIADSAINLAIREMIPSI
jgi:hypothetical protein